MNPESILKLASELGVENKIDPSTLTENGVLENWHRVLMKLEDFRVKCDLSGGKFDTIHTIKNPQNFRSDTNKYRSVVARIHETFDDFPEDVGMDVDEEETTPPSVSPSSAYGTDIDIDVHIVDVDYEYDYATGMNIILYTRVIGSDDTVFVKCPYNDYFYIQLSDGVSPELIKKRIDGYCWFLKNIKYKKAVETVTMGADNRRHPINIDFTCKPLVTDMEVVHGLKSMYGYQPDDQTFLKISTVNPTVTMDLFNGLSKKFNGETRVKTIRDDSTGKQVETSEYEYFPEMHFFEAKIDVTNKFLTEHALSGCAAVNIKGKRLGEGKSPFSTCTIAMEASTLAPLPDAPFYEPRTLFYDIECLSLDINEFPTSDRCPIIQISYLSAKGTETVDQGVFCYKETPGYEWYNTEEQMLIAFAKKIVDFNPDNITGFNSNCFDMPYILDRMEVLGITDVASCWSRRLGINMVYKRDFRESKQFGTKEIVKYTTPGRVMFDQMEIIKGNPMIRLRSYALKNICAEFLGDDNKEDLRYKDIPDLFKTIEGRQKIASYCLQDTVLLKKLDDKMMMGVDIAGQAKVQGITTNVVLNRGLVFRINCKIKQYTERYNFLIPTFSKKQFPNSPTYQGATVLNCDAGYYTDPVVVLDFASLYPSLIRSHNLDYTTIAMDKAVVEKYPERFNKFDNGYAFVKSEFLRGLLPRIETELGLERDAAKKKMKAAKDDVEKAVWNAIQGGVKIVMNSIYGLAGSPTATVPCVPIAATITFMGRTHLQQSKEYVEANYCRITGEPPANQCKVIYGDSVTPDTPMTVKYYDSVLVMNVRDIEREFGVGTWVIMRDGDDKESLELKDGLFSWTEGGWTKLERMIRHFCQKDVVAVTTHTGYVKCTVDHSLVTSTGNAIKPSECVLNSTELLHSPPPPSHVVGMHVYDMKYGESLDGEYLTPADYAMAFNKTTAAVYNMIAKGKVQWTPNTYKVTLDVRLASVMGMFVGDGSCGAYEMKRGVKYSWAINNSDATLLTKYKIHLEHCFPFVGFKILNTIGSSGVYKLVPHSDGKKGIIRDFVVWWRHACYYDNGEKKVPDEIYNTAVDVQKAFLSGIYDSDGTKSQTDLLEVSFKGERVCQGVTTVMYMTGYEHVVIDTRADKPQMFRLRGRTTKQLRKLPHAVKKIEPVHYLGYVYDFTTSNHHFQAGVGNMIVHNTDSIFILMPNVSNETAIKHGQKLDENIKSELFGHLECLVMEYEKTFNPYIQVTPKRYAGYKMEFDASKGKVAASGLQLVKRDSALLCKRTMTTFFDYLLVKKDKDKALESIKVQMADLYANNLPLEDFEITKKISKKPDAYKSCPPHVLAWQRMVERVGVTEAPAVGERFAYIIEKHGKKDKLSDAMVDSDLVREKGFGRFNIAKDHYFNLYVYNPMHVITELVYGKPLSDQVLNPRAYENIETITAKKGSILGFFKKDQLTSKRRWHGMGVDEKLMAEIRQMRISDYKVEEEVIDDGEGVVASAT